MAQRTWLITGVSSGFGFEMTKQLLAKGDTVIGTVRNKDKVQKLIEDYPITFDCRILDVTDVPGIHALVADAFLTHGKIDVIVSNAGYGLFGCAEELSDEEINHIIATNLVGSIMLIRDSLPHLRAGVSFRCPLMAARLLIRPTPCTMRPSSESKAFARRWHRKSASLELA